MARGGGKAFNTIAGLLVLVGAILVGFYVLRGVAKAGVGKRLESIGGILGNGGTGILGPIGGGQFGPATAPLGNTQPAFTSTTKQQLVTPTATPQTVGGFTVTTGGVDLLSGILAKAGIGGGVTPERAATLPTYNPTGPAPTYVAGEDGVSIYGAGIGGIGQVPLNARFLGYSPGTNIPIFG